MSGRRTVRTRSSTTTTRVTRSSTSSSARSNSSGLVSLDSPTTPSVRRGRARSRGTSNARAAPYRVSHSQSGGSSSTALDAAPNHDAEPQPIVEILDIATPTRPRPPRGSAAPLVDLTCDWDEDFPREEVYVLLEDIARPRADRPLDMRIRPRLRQPRTTNETVTVDTDSDIEDRTPREMLASTGKQPSLNPESLITCPICFDGLAQMKEQKKQVYSTVCGHLFCQPCITASIEGNRQCPTCRKNLSLRQIHPLFI